MHSTFDEYPALGSHPDEQNSAMREEISTRIAHLYFVASRMAAFFQPGLCFKTIFVADAHVHISAISEAQWAHIKGLAPQLLQAPPTMVSVDITDAERIITLAARIFVIEDAPSVALGQHAHDAIQPPLVTWGAYGAQGDTGSLPPTATQSPEAHGLTTVPFDDIPLTLTAAIMHGPYHHSIRQEPPSLTDEYAEMPTSHTAYPEGGLVYHDSEAHGDTQPEQHAHPSTHTIVSQLPISSGGVHCIFCESGDRPGKLFKDLSRHMFRHFDAFEAEGATGSHVLSIFHRVRYGDTQGLADIGTFWDAYADFVAGGATGNSGGVRETSEAAISIDDIISTGVLLSSGTFSSIFQCKSAPKGNSRADIVARVLSTIQYMGRESRVRAAKRLAAVTRTPRLFRTFVCTWWLEALRIEEIQLENAGLTDEFWEAANAGTAANTASTDSQHTNTV